MFPQTHHVECVALLDLAAESNELILASASPRRRDFLAALGLNFQVMPADLMEESYPEESPKETVARLALSKALAVAAGINSGFIIAADSMVVFDGKALGKPEDTADARRMLRLLRGTSHQVTTGVTVLNAASGRHLIDTMTSGVNLRRFTDYEIEASILAGTPMDKAGAYAVQDQVLHPAESWQGCYSNIVGLPLCLVRQMLEDLRWDVSDWRISAASEYCGPTCPNNGGNRP